MVKEDMKEKTPGEGVGVNHIDNISFGSFYINRPTDFHRFSHWRRLKRLMCSYHFT